jgi:hypothetical protein
MDNFNFIKGLQIYFEELNNISKSLKHFDLWRQTEGGGFGYLDK